MNYMSYLTVIKRENIHNDEIRRNYAKSIKSWNPKRAEFINIQLDMRSKGLTEDSWLLLHERSKELLIENGKKWVPKRLNDYKPTFYRGFVEGIDLNTGLFLKRVKEIYHAAPIRHLILRKSKNVASDLFNSPNLSEIVSLTFSKNRELDSKLTNKEVEMISNSPYLKKLAMLELRSNNITIEGLGMLATSKNLPHLQYVGISGNDELASGFEEIISENGEIKSVMPTKLSEMLINVNGPKLWLNRVVRGKSLIPHPNDF